MNELTKKLKDAKFPFKQIEVQGRVLPNEEDYIPALEELMEMCGDKFYSLVLKEGKWMANGVFPKTIESFYGSTPSEAVTNLWLALQEKK